MIFVLNFVVFENNVNLDIKYNVKATNMKTMKIIFVCMLLCITSHILKAEPNSTANKYYLHSLAFQTMSEEKQKVIDLWIDFLYNPDANLRKTFWDAYDSKAFQKSILLVCIHCISE